MANDRDNSAEQPKLFYDNIMHNVLLHRHLENEARRLAEQNRAVGGHGITYPRSNSQDYPLDAHKRRGWPRPDDDDDKGKGGAGVPRKPNPTPSSPPTRVRRDESGNFIPEKLDEANRWVPQQITLPQKKGK